MRAPMPPVLGLVLFGLVSAGCATRTEYVTLAYHPLPNVAKIDLANTVTVRVEVVDARSRPDRVSTKRNVYKEERAPFISDSDVASHVAGAIELELRDRGFEIGDGSAAVVVQLKTFYTDMQFATWSATAAGEASMAVEVRRPGGAVFFSKTVDGQGNLTGLQSLSVQDVQNALEIALQDAISKLMNDPAFAEALFAAAGG